MHPLYQYMWYYIRFQINTPVFQYNAIVLQVYEQYIASIDCIQLHILNIRAS